MVDTTPVPVARMAGLSATTLGAGKIGELAAQFEVIKREERKAERVFSKADREEVANLDTPLLELNELADLLMKAALLAAGFHQHNRGNWRKCRGNRDNSTELAVPTTVEQVRNLLKRAATDDVTTVPAIRKLLDNPETIELFGGNLAKRAQRSFVDAISGKDISAREAVHAKLAAMREELLGEKPTPVEWLLVGRIVTCWLQVQDAEIRAAQAKDVTFRQADFNQRRMDA